MCLKGSKLGSGVIRVTRSLKGEEQKQGDWFSLLPQCLDSRCGRPAPGRWQSEWRKERDARNSYEITLENEGVEGGLEVAMKLHLSTFN